MVFAVRGVSNLSLLSPSALVVNLQLIRLDVCVTAGERNSMRDTPASQEVLSHLLTCETSHRLQKIKNKMGNACHSCCSRLVGNRSKLCQLRGLCVSAVIRPVRKTKCCVMTRKERGKKKKMASSEKISSESQDFVQPPRSLCDSNAVFLFRQRRRFNLCCDKSSAGDRRRTRLLQMSTRRGQMSASV